MIELKIALQPKQKLFLQTIESTPITLYGGAKGGGKSKGLRDIMLLRRFKYPGSNGAIFRKTFPELDGNHIRPLLTEFPFLSTYYNESKKLLTLPNKSTLQFCHCQSEKDVGLYQGREFHDLGIEEAGEWTEEMFRRLMGSNRSSISGIKPRAMLTGNPGGIGHKWLKRLFIQRDFKLDERPEDYAFIQATVDDNPALMENDPAYVRRLEAEPNEALRKAFRYGSWEIFAGQFFSEIRRDVHLIKPFNIPEHWTRFGSYDFGFNHPAAFGWFANDEDGNVFQYRELIEAQLRIDQFAAKMNEHSDTKNLYPIVAGHDCWTQKGVLNDKSPPTVADEFKTHGIMLKKATIDRVQGAAQLRKYLAWQNLSDKRTKPRFFIFDTCPISFDCLTRVQHDPKRVEDVLKVDAIEGDPYSGDDAYDMIRYGLMSKPFLSEPAVISHPRGTPEWAKQEVENMEEAAQEYFENLEKQQGEAW